MYTCVVIVTFVVIVDFSFVFCLVQLPLCFHCIEWFGHIRIAEFVCFKSGMGDFFANDVLKKSDVITFLYVAI